MHLTYHPQVTGWRRSKSQPPIKERFPCLTGALVPTRLEGMGHRVMCKMEEEVGANEKARRASAV